MFLCFLFLIFFIKGYVVGVDLNCIDKLMQLTSQSAQWGMYTPDQSYPHFLTLEMKDVCYNIERL